MKLGAQSIKIPYVKNIIWFISIIVLIAKKIIVLNVIKVMKNIRLKFLILIIPSHFNKNKMLGLINKRKKNFEKVIEKFENWKNDIIKIAEDIKKQLRDEISILEKMFCPI